MADLNLGARQIVRTGAREFVTRQIADETLVVPVAGGVGDLDAIYTLNPVAARIWQILERPTTLERIVDEITRGFEVSTEQATRDVAEFLGTLQAGGLIQPADEPGTAA
jgi:hypothetical protein